MRRGLFNVTAFAIAMANVETMIVVYLRRLYYPDGFTFPLKIIDIPTLVLELAREALRLAQQKLPLKTKVVVRPDYTE